ncbi:MAG: RNA polymerase sigma factor, partial [Myxococcales bacterium]
SPGRRADASVDLETLASSLRAPDDAASDAEAARIAHAMLAQLDDDKRSVFVLVELEGLGVPEVAEATGTNINTIYARLRAARSEFSATVARFHAAERRRAP